MKNLLFMNMESSSNPTIILSKAYRIGDLSGFIKFPGTDTIIYRDYADETVYFSSLVQNKGLPEIHRLDYGVYKKGTVFLPRLYPGGDILYFDCLGAPATRIKQESKMLLKDLPLYVNLGILIPMNQDELLAYEYGIL